MVQHAEGGGWVFPQLSPRHSQARPTDQQRLRSYHKKFARIWNKFHHIARRHLREPPLMLLYVANNRDVFGPKPLITVSSLHCTERNGHVLCSPTPESWHRRFCDQQNFVENGDAKSSYSDETRMVVYCLHVTHTSIRILENFQSGWLRTLYDQFQKILQDDAVYILCTRL